MFYIYIHNIFIFIYFVFKVYLSKVVLLDGLQCLRIHEKFTAFCNVLGNLNFKTNLSKYEVLVLVIVHVTAMNRIEGAFSPIHECIVTNSNSIPVWEKEEMADTEEQKE